MSEFTNKVDIKLKDESNPTIGTPVTNTTNTTTTVNSGNEHNAKDTEYMPQFWDTSVKKEITTPTTCATTGTTGTTGTSTVSTQKLTSQSLDKPDVAKKTLNKLSSRPDGLDLASTLSSPPSILENEEIDKQKLEQKLQKSIVSNLVNQNLAVSDKVTNSPIKPESDQSPSKNFDKNGLSYVEQIVRKLEKEAETNSQDSQMNAGTVFKRLLTLYPKDFVYILVELVWKGLTNTSSNFVDVTSEDGKKEIQTENRVTRQKRKTRSTSRVGRNTRNSRKQQKKAKITSPPESTTTEEETILQSGKPAARGRTRSSSLKKNVTGRSRGRGRGRKAKKQPAVSHSPADTESTDTDFDQARTTGQKRQRKF